MLRLVTYPCVSSPVGDSLQLDRKVLSIPRKIIKPNLLPLPHGVTILARCEESNT